MDWRQLLLVSALERLLSQHGSHRQGDLEQQLSLHWLICSDGSLQITLNILNIIPFESFRKKYSGAPSRNLGMKLHVAYYSTFS